MLKNIRATEVARARKGIYDIVTDGAPTANDGVGVCGKGSTCIDRVNGKQYINTGDATTPAWTVTGTQT